MGAVAGLVVGAAVALAIVGAAWRRWALALGIALPIHAVLGAVSTRNDRSTLAGALALFALPLFSVIDGRPRRVVAVLVVSALAIVLTAWRGGPSRAAAAVSPAH